MAKRNHFIVVRQYNRINPDVNTLIGEIFRLGLMVHFKKLIIIFKPVDRQRSAEDTLHWPLAWLIQLLKIEQVLLSGRFVYMFENPRNNQTK